MQKNYFICFSNDTLRTATWLTYLNEPIYGGKTAFLNLEIAAEPVKNSAVFWYNHFVIFLTKFQARKTILMMILTEIYKIIAKLKKLRVYVISFIYFIVIFIQNYFISYCQYLIMSYTLLQFIVLYNSILN